MFASAFFESAVPRVRRPHTILDTYSDLFLENPKNDDKKYVVRVPFSTTREFDELCAKTIQNFVVEFQKQSKEMKATITADLMIRARQINDEQLRFCIDFIDYCSTTLVKGEEVDTGFPMKVAQVIADRYNEMMNPEPVDKSMAQSRRPQRQNDKAGKIERQSSMMLRK